MDYKATILAVDDDLATRTIVKDFLEEEGYRVIVSAHGDELLKSLNIARPDLVLLDVMLPDKDGLPLINAIKSTHAVPVIIISDKDSTMDKVVGLQMGADDYLGKPYELPELSARIKANLRLVGMVEDNLQNDTAQSKDAYLIKFGGWLLNRKTMQVLDENNTPAQLTAGEFQLLETFVLSPNQVLSREQLFDMTREGELEAYDRTIDIQIGRIRKKLGDNPEMPLYIKTVRGAGYMLVSDTKTQT